MKKLVATCVLGLLVLAAGGVVYCLRLHEDEFDYALRLSQAGELEEAVAAWDRLSREEPVHALVWYNLGTILWRQAEEQNRSESERIALYERACRTFEKAAQAAPTYEDIYLNWGHCLAGLAEFEADDVEACALYERAYVMMEGIEPNCAERWTSRGYVLKQWGLRDMAHAQERFRQAVKYFKKAHDCAGDDAGIYFYWGSSLQNLAGEVYPDREALLTEAVDKYRRAVACDPDMAEAYINLGGCLDNLAEFSTEPQTLLEEACSHFEKALGLWEDDAIGQASYGLTLVHLARLDEKSAAELYERARARFVRAGELGLDVSEQLEMIAAARDTPEHAIE